MRRSKNVELAHLHVKMSENEYNMLMAKMGLKYTQSERGGIVSLVIALILFAFNGLNARMHLVDFPRYVDTSMLMVLLVCLVLCLMAIGYQDKWYERRMILSEAFRKFPYSDQDHEQWSTRAFDGKLIAWIKTHPGLADVDKRGRYATVAPQQVEDLEVSPEREQ